MEGGSENRPDPAGDDVLLKGAGLTPCTGCLGLDCTSSWTCVERQVVSLLKSSVASPACAMFLTMCLLSAGILKGAGHSYPGGSSKVEVQRGKRTFFFNPTSNVTFEAVKLFPS